jgi:hypothetical protein
MKMKGKLNEKEVKEELELFKIEGIKIINPEKHDQNN